MISNNCYKQQESYYSPYNSNVMLESKQTAHSMETPDPSYCSGYPLTHVNDHGQYPSHQEFEEIVQDYLQNLSSKKRDKALIDQKRYRMVLQVLKDPRNTSLSTAQFRFWVKKMFRLTAKHVVCHDGKPVATREQIYSILVRAHREVHHGGRDKTSTLVFLDTQRIDCTVCSALSILYITKKW
ncbi:hypothetical protein CU098_008836 [Rhizopus stolonifer]|uniref:Integrase zinc-binding domain-containing protein n=1 Tax=Rhizopus stolonifer TaxID=4846 RepID=A0A367J734_RHIST|nr:hypothetical protein CU098_008836 [Rhizopus stolonifer]